MTEGEIVLLESTRDLLRSKMSLTAPECDCEYDEEVPAIAGHRYIAVIPAGLRTGPTHNSSAGVHDVVHSLRVVVFIRSTSTPRDRSRSIFLSQLNSLNQTIDRIVKLLDWQLDAFSFLNHRLQVMYAGAQPFVEMLRLQDIEAKPRMISNEIYAASSATQAGANRYTAMRRSVTFGGCRRITTITQVGP